MWRFRTPILNSPTSFFIHEHFQRFLTTEHNRTGAWWYFVPYLLAGSMPWLSVLPQALRQGWAKSAAEHFQPNRFLLIWAVFIFFLFFSRSDSKLPSYILPIFPALAMLSAQVLARLSSRALRWHLLVVAGRVATLVAVPWVAKLSSEKNAADL